MHKQSNNRTVFVLKNKHKVNYKTIVYAMEKLIEMELSGEDCATSMEDVFSEDGLPLNRELFPEGWKDFTVEGDPTEKKDVWGARILLLLIYMSLTKLDSAGVEKEV